MQGGLSVMTGEIVKSHERIRELEALNALLAEQVDRMRPVISAAWAWRLSNAAPARAVVLSEAVDEYEKQMAQFAKEGK